jgi:hypothetical protein
VQVQAAAIELRTDEKGEPVARIVPAFGAHGSLHGAKARIGCRQRAGQSDFEGFESSNGRWTISRDLGDRSGRARCVDRDGLDAHRLARCPSH